MSIEVQHVSKHFGNFTALRDVSLRVDAGELVALLGPSGSGKTTLLRIISGLEVPDEGGGQILLHDEDVTECRVGARRVGFVFQHYALFRHMTVFENVAFGLRARPRKSRPDKQLIHDKVIQLLKLVQLDWLADRYPAQLSGGQRQRVALARALAIEPTVLLLDEPFGSLDAKTRQELRKWLRRLHDELRITSVLVTHDQEEALEVADRVVIMNAGRIEQMGTPEEVFHHSANEFVMNFLGHVNVFHGRMEQGRVHFDEVVVKAPQGTERKSGPVRVFVRPHDWMVEKNANGEPCVRATVCEINLAGPVARLQLTTEFGNVVDVELPHDRYRDLELRPGEAVFLVPREMKLFVDDNDIYAAEQAAREQREREQRLLSPSGP